MRIILGVFLGLAVMPLWAQEEGSDAWPGLVNPGGMLVFYHSEGPLSFVTMTPAELPGKAVDIGEVKGRSCQYGLSIPITAQMRPTSVSGAGGDGGYRKTLQSMIRARAELAGIYDVKVDLHTLSILGIYRRVCTEITARGFKLG